MGFRTLVLLYNDQSKEWENDPELGKKIVIGMNHVARDRKDLYGPSYLGYGRVVECTHADTETLAVVSSYSFNPVARSSWYMNKDEATTKMELLRQAADSMGYRLVKKSVK
jgi:hypothetical protein